MTVLKNGSRKLGSNLHQRRKSDDLKSPAMMQIHRSREKLNNTTQESSFAYLKGIGYNH